MAVNYPDCYFFEGGVGQSASRVNGEFFKSDQMQGGRPVYIHDDNGKDVALWFWEKKSFWMISPKSAIGTQNAYACIRNSALPHKIETGWLVFSKENQNYVPSGLTAMIAGDEEDSSDSDSIDAQLLKPRERSKTPELDGAQSYDDTQDRERTPSPEQGIPADKVKFLKNPAPRSLPDEHEGDDADELIEGMANDIREQEEAKEEDDTAPKAPRDGRYFMHDTRSKAPGRAKGRCHMDDEESSDDEEQKEGEKENEEVQEEEVQEEEEPVPNSPVRKKKADKWGHDFFERIERGEKVEHWESSSFHNNNRRRRGGRGNFGGGRGRRRNFDDDYGAGRGSGVQYDYGRGGDEGYDRRGEGHDRRSGRGGRRRNDYGGDDDYGNRNDYNDYGGEYGGHDRRQGEGYDNPYDQRDRRGEFSSNARSDEPQRFKRGGRRGRRSRGRGAY